MLTIYLDGGNKFAQWRCDDVCYAGYRWILKQLGDDLTEADIDDMIADVDTDGSGWVDFEGNYLSAVVSSEYQ